MRKALERKGWFWVGEHIAKAVLIICLVVLICMAVKFNDPIFWLFSALVFAFVFALVYPRRNQHSRS
jgi:hypothetical protein